VTIPAVTKAAAAHLTPEAAVTVAIHPKEHALAWGNGAREAAN
jgi:hypothetical protein